ncbi:hypothetical protein L248_2573 [Schleiferilactobacillus shenzhenensis LY-73]|uniref:Uncharacterized protein n=1 Tax=Schleiferilactobacillus shenzhenensis LY-73 TaxID=1231336 RepID=U4TPX8_9LACO|nr:hypothetical protein L248_2573 [Schleiferilactobacillus shenzhenensis LY-73]
MVHPCFLNFLTPVYRAGAERKLTGIKFRQTSHDESPISVPAAFETAIMVQSRSKKHSFWRRIF